MSVIILVGPSHAGKSTLGRKVSKNLRIDYHDVDIKAKVRDPDYMSSAKKLLGKYKSSKKAHILDFGAGFQNHRDSCTLFSPFAEFMITIWEKPEILYKHHKQGNPNLQFGDFQHIEYRPKRTEIYEMSKYRLDRTWNDIEGDTTKLETIIRGSLLPRLIGERLRTKNHENREEP